MDKDTIKLGFTKSESGWASYLEITPEGISLVDAKGKSKVQVSEQEVKTSSSGGRLAVGPSGVQTDNIDGGPS